MKPSLIVHPLSYSVSGKSARARALALARWYQADLHILELRARQAAFQSPLVRRFTDGSVEPHLADFVQSVGISLERVSAVEVKGDVVLAIVDYAKQAAADLVVVASHARSHDPYWRSGAYANDLARHLSCPTLTVPVTRGVDIYSSGPPFTKILCATDLPVASTTVVEHAARLAQESGATLALVHVQEDLPYKAIFSNDPKLDVAQISSDMVRSVRTSAFKTSEIHTIVVLVSRAGPFLKQPRTTART